jgi:hypothetical protein
VNTMTLTKSGTYHYLLPFGVERIVLPPGETVLQARPSISARLVYLSGFIGVPSLRVRSLRVGVREQLAIPTPLEVLSSPRLEYMVRLDVCRPYSAITVTIENYGQASPPDMLWAICREEP